jgi:small subunit ribosomal protein YMR-31
MSGASLGPIAPGSGIAFDKSELPDKFYQRIPWTQAEIEAIESGGATTIS